MKHGSCIMDHKSNLFWNSCILITCSWRKARKAMTKLVLVLLLIGWKSGANLLSQSRSVVNAKPITFRHSNDRRRCRCSLSTFLEPLAYWRHWTDLDIRTNLSDLLLLLGVVLAIVVAPNRELKQQRRRCRGRNQEKNEFVFYQRNQSWLSRSVRFANGSKNVLKICNGGFQFQVEIRKISRCRPRSVDDAELGHFTLLFCRGQQRNVQRFITHVHSYCFAH